MSRARSADNEPLVRKAANAERTPPALADLPRRQQLTFERDFQRVTGTPLGAAAKRAGRAYVAIGWRAYHDAVFGRPRVRKGPNECRDPHCPCANHRRAQRQPPLVDERLTRAYVERGPEYP